MPPLQASARQDLLGIPSPGAETPHRGRSLAPLYQGAFAEENVQMKAKLLRRKMVRVKRRNVPTVGFLLSGVKAVVVYFQGDLLSMPPTAAFESSRLKYRT